MGAAPLSLHLLPLWGAAAWHINLDRPNVTPDDDVFRHLAQTYASSHAIMWKGLPCKDSRGYSKNMREFPNGTVNGAAWYTLTGDLNSTINSANFAAASMGLELFDSP